MTEDSAISAEAAEDFAGDETARQPSRRLIRFLQSLWPGLALAVGVYPALLLTAPGYVGADTKQYLYLDPDRLLSRASYLWDPHVGMGGVTHQNISYLLPQGPWYWVFEKLSVPDWVAQRLWTGTLLWLAGMGVLVLMRSFGWASRPAFLAAAGYMLSPYLLEYVSRISSILLPWAGMPWMVAFTVRGLRWHALSNRIRRADDPTHDSQEHESDVDSLAHSRLQDALGRWRYPALFAIVVALVGGANATTLIYAGLAPVLWVPFAILRREVRWRQALGFAARTTGLTLAVSAWWLGGLASQAGYGLDVLAYSETLQTVASDSQASEVLRGLGNWYFYGRDGISVWVQPSLSYTGNLALIAVSFLVPVLSLIAGVLLRWVHRAYFVTLVLVGTALAVGVYPYDHPSPAGSLFKAFAESSTAGLALRSTPRAVPLVALGLMVLLAAGIEALFHLPARPRRELGAVVRHRAGSTPVLRGAAPALAFVIVLGLIAVDMLPLWRGQFVDPNLRRPEKLPSYITAAAASLNAAPSIAGSQTRVLELPGADFSQYRWGTTLDPPLPGLMDRPYVSRELIPAGTPASAALVRAIDRRLQEGVFETSSLPALARLMGVGDVVLRNDLQYERFRTPQPRSTWETWTRLRPDGLSLPKTFGPPVAEDPAIPFIDEITLGAPATTPDPPAMADYSVTDAVPIVRAENADSPLLIAGDSEGLVDASAAGLLADTGVVRYAASKASVSGKAAVPKDADLLLTDSNRKRAERWGTVRDNFGYTETATGHPLVKDPNDARLPVFPGQSTADQTIAVQSGIADVEASGYGNAVSYSPAERPIHAVDGDTTTAWKVGAFADPRGERLRVTLKSNVTTDHLNLIQPQDGPATRSITKASLSFDGGPVMTVDMGPQSLSAHGQVVRFPSRSFRQVEFKILQTTNGTLRNYDGQSGVGLAELAIPGVKGSELLRLPTDLFKTAGTDGSNQRLTVMLTRDRASAQEPFKTDDELSMAREFTLPTERSFGVGGTARISANITDAKLDSLLGRGRNVTATSSGALPGSLTARAAAAADGDPTTAWTNTFGGNDGSWLQLQSTAEVSLSSLDLQIVADGRHSVPTALTLEVDGKPVRNLALPPLRDAMKADATSAVQVNFPRVKGKTFRLIVKSVRVENTTDYFKHTPLELPVAIAEFGAPALRVSRVAPDLTSACRSDLLTIDGLPVSLQIGGSTTAGIRRDGLDIRMCGNLTLAAGTHVLRTSLGQDTGFAVDRLLLSSAAVGRAGDPTNPFPGTTRTNTPVHVTVTGQNPVAYRLNVSGATPGKPFWLVLGESLSPGWSAKLIGGSTLGTPQLVDGYANGWLIRPTAGTFSVSLDWKPQHRVWIGIGISVVGLLICLLLALRRAPHASRRGRSGALVAHPRPVPVLTSPLSDGRVRAPRGRAAIATVVVGGVSAVLVNPLAGLVALALTAIALLLPRGRVVVRVGAVAALAISAAYVLNVQRKYSLPETGKWVQEFHRVATVSWFAVLLIFADVMIGWARRDVTTGQVDLKQLDRAQIDSEQTSADAVSEPLRPS